MLLPAALCSQTLPPPEHRHLARAILEELVEINTVRAAVPMYNSSMRTTCVATMLQAGHAENALPQRAQATIQCRLLPGDSPEETRATLARVLTDTLIRVTLPDKPDISPASPLSPEVMMAVERVTASMWPGVVVLPVMDPWSTDGLTSGGPAFLSTVSPESSTTSMTCARMARTSEWGSRPSMRAWSSCTG